MISLREVNDVDVHGSVVTCDVVTSVDTDNVDLIAAGSAVTFSSDGIDNHLVHGNVIADHAIDGGVSDEMNGHEGLTLAQEQIVETSEDPIDNLFSVEYSNDIQPQFRVLGNDNGESVPSAGHLVTMTEDGLMLACETVEFDPVDETDQGHPKEAVLNVKDIIEVDQTLVPYRGNDEDVQGSAENEDSNSVSINEGESEDDGGKRLFIQDANGQVFYIPCPEGFTVEPENSNQNVDPLSEELTSDNRTCDSIPLNDDTDASTSSFPDATAPSSSKRLSAWLSTIVAEDTSSSLSASFSVETSFPTDTSSTAKLSNVPSASTVGPSTKNKSRKRKTRTWESNSDGAGPTLDAGELNRQLKTVLPGFVAENTPSPPTKAGRRDQEKIGRRVKALKQKLQKEFRDANLKPGQTKVEEINYETGYDPATGEVKGPNISEFALSSFVEREVKSADDICKLWTLTPRDKKILHKKGIKWKEGPWGHDEAEVLDENIKNYCLERGYEDPSKVIFSMSKDDRKNFYPLIARGIQRPVFAVYRRVQRDYDPNNHKGVYSKAELAQLSALLQEYGNDYKLIAETLGRSIESVRDRCRHMHDGRSLLSPKDRLVGFNRGKWMRTEEKKLILAVHQILQMPRKKEEEEEDQAATTDTQALDEIPWSEVAALVKTRTPTQCRRKWSETLKRSEESRKEAAAEQSTDLSLLRNLDKVFASEPLTLMPVDDDAPSNTISSSTITLSRLQENATISLSQAQPFQSLTHQSLYPGQVQPAAQHFDLVLTRPVGKPPHEELILFDDQTFSNLQISYVTSLE